MPQSPNRVLLAATIAAATLGSLTIAEPAFEIDGQTLVWSHVEPLPNAALQLTVLGPEGFLLTRTFANGELVSLPRAELTIDGQYTAHIRTLPNVSAAILEQIRAGLAQAPEAHSWTTRFSVRNGQVADPSVIEAPAGNLEARLTDVVNDDQVVIGSLCVGGDCEANESFGFDTIRLREDNLRMHFDDTSDSASFPGNDWRFEFNASSNGGGSYFGVVDSTANTTPFRVDAGAPNNALYVDSDGRVGVGTPTPTVELHAVDGDSPTFRFDQDGSDGFQAYIWDIAGNETNFFVRDVTDGSKLPLRIFPGSPTDNLTIRNGRIGITENSPDVELHIRRQGDARIGLESTVDDVADWSVSNNSASGQFEISDTADGDVAADPDGVELALDASGNLTIAGLLVQNSDRDSKHRVRHLDANEVLKRVQQLPISRWQYKSTDGDHIGPMAQDFYAQFGLGQTANKIATLDVAGVALVAIQGLSDELVERDRAIAKLSRQVAELTTTVQQQQTALTEQANYAERLAQVERQLAAQLAPTNQAIAEHRHDQ